VSRSKEQPPDRSKAGADFLLLNLEQAPAGGLSDWLAEQLRRAIADGRLPVGGTLPPSRVLSEELRVSRGVVTEAYQRLIEDGQAVGLGRAGTVVVAAPIGTPPPARNPEVAVRRDPPVSPPPAPPVFAAAPDSDVFDALRANPARFDFTPGVPDLTAFPRAAWLRASPPPTSATGIRAARPRSGRRSSTGSRGFGACAPSPAR
jgi:GntR family transcriptional regulator / MocR family aminotransferase